MLRSGIDGKSLCKHLDSPVRVMYRPDEHAGHGNFRAWAKITAHTVTGLQRLDRPHPDQQVLQRVINQLDGHDT